MPLQKKGSKEECLSYNYKEMKASGHSKEQSRAATLNFCGKHWGGISKKKSKHEELSDNIIFMLEDYKEIDRKLVECKQSIDNLRKKNK